MSDQEKEIQQDSNDHKAKFREALEKKKKDNGIRNSNVSGGPKISGGQSGGNAPKMFRRKSGSS
jgi:hypothetical protein